MKQDPPSSVEGLASQTNLLGNDILDWPGSYNFSVRFGVLSFTGVCAI